MKYGSTPSLRSDLSWLALLAVMAALWVLIESLGAPLLQRYDATQIVGMRYVFHLLALALIVVPGGACRLFQTGRRGVQIARGVCMFVMPISMTITGLGLSSGNLWALFWVAPLLILLIAALWTRESVQPLVWLLTVIGYIGALLIIQPDYASLVALNAAFPLLGGLSFAVYVVLSRELRGEHPATSLFHTACGTLVLVTPLMLMNWQPLAVADAAVLASIGVAGLMFLFLLDRAVEAFPACVIAPFLFWVVGWEAVVRAVARRDLPSISVVAGCVLLSSAMAALLRRPRAGESHD